MSKDKRTRRSVLRTSGVALAAMTGVPIGASAAPECIGCGDDDDDGGDDSDGSPPSVSTEHSIVNSSCDLSVHGFLGSLGDDDEADVWFDYGKEGEGLPNDTNLKTMYDTGSFCDGDGCWYDSFGCLDPGTYEYRAVATNSWGKTTGSIRTFTV